MPRSKPQEGQAVLHSVTALINNLLDYFADHLSDITQLTPCIVSTNHPRRPLPILTAQKDALFSLLDITLAASVNCLRTYLAQRTFEALYPTLVVSSAIDPEWNTGENLVLGALVLFSILTLSNDSMDPRFRLPQTGWVMTLLRFRFQATLHLESLYSWRIWTCRILITLHCLRRIFPPF